MVDHHLYMVKPAIMRIYISWNSVSWRGSLLWLYMVDMVIRWTINSELLIAFSLVAVKNDEKTGKLPRLTPVARWQKRQIFVLWTQQSSATIDCCGIWLSSTSRCGWTPCSWRRRAWTTYGSADHEREGGRTTLDDWKHQWLHRGVVHQDLSTRALSGLVQASVVYWILAKRRMMILRVEHPIIAVTSSI